MATTRNVFARFGLGYAGLATVGYRLWTPSGGFQARVTAGVSEPAAGLYAASLSVPDGFDGMILWDTAAGSGIEASEPLASPVGTAAAQANASAAAARLLTMTSVEVEAAVPAAPLDSLYGDHRTIMHSEPGADPDTLNVYKSDGTLLGVKGLTSDADAVPTTGWRTP